MAAPKHRLRADIWRQRSVGWLTVIVLGILLYIFAGKLQERGGEAETAAVQVVVNNLQAQLRIEQSTALVTGEPERVRALVGSDPMKLVAETPDGYLGPCSEREPGQSGVWCFDGADVGVLRYYPRFEGVVPESSRQEDSMGWRVELQRAETESGSGELLLQPITESGN